LAKRVVMALVRNALLISADSLSTTSYGSFAGPMIPYHCDVSNPG